MNTLSCDEAEALLADNALRRLDATKHAEVAAHLKTCASCRTAYAEFTAIAEGLLHASAPHPVPPDIKAELMSRVRAEQTVDRARQQAAHVSVWDRLMDWLRGSSVMPRAALAGGVAVALLAFGGLGYQAARQANERATLVSQLQLHQRGQTIALAPQEAAPEAVATLTFDPQHMVAVFTSGGLPILPETQAYQLWLFGEDGNPIPSSVFDAQSAQSVVVDAPQTFQTYTQFAVSIEPRGGSKQPTGLIALIGKVT